jgi:hypothetical protein
MKIMVFAAVAVLYISMVVAVRDIETRPAAKRVGCMEIFKGSACDP